MPIKFCIFLFGWLSHSGIRHVATLLKWLSWPFTWKMRKIIVTNLKIAFPEKKASELRRISNDNLQFMIEMALETICAIKHPDILEKEVRQAKYPYDDTARDNGEIWITLHMGFWEAMSRMKKFTGKAGSVVMAEFDYAPLDITLKQLRSYHGTELIFDHGAALGFTRALKQNRAVGILIDQNISPKYGGIFVNFFGLPAPTSKLPASMAISLNVPIVLCCCLRNSDGSLETITRRLDKAPAEYENDLELTQEIFKIYEELIKLRPEQYLWMYRKWRYIPADMPDELKAKMPFYAKVYPQYRLHEDNSIKAVKQRILMEKQYTENDIC